MTKNTKRLLGLAILVLLGATYWNLYERQHTIQKQQDKFRVEQEQLARQQVEMADAIRNSGLFVLMGQLLEQVQTELAEEPIGHLSEGTIARIAALSHGCRPYLQPGNDSIAPLKLSPARGQLLLALINMPIDSAVFARIKQQTDFSGADLHGANLEGADLRRIKLAKADLSETQLRGTFFNGANLNGTSFWAADAARAVWRKAKLKEANLSWANLSGADFRGANMQGASLEHAELRKARLQRSDLVYAAFDGAVLREARMDYADGRVVSFARAQLQDAVLKNMDVRKIIFTESVLTGVNLEGARIEPGWLEDLAAAQAEGSDAVAKKYQMELDTTEKSSVYRLVVKTK